MGRVLQNAIKNGDPTRFSDPIWVADCSGRFRERNLSTQLHAVKLLQTDSDAISFLENQTLVLRIGESPQFYFKAEKQNNRYFKIVKIMQQCSANNTAFHLHKHYKDLRSGNFAEVLTDPYRMGACGYKTATYSLQFLADYNKFDFRYGLNAYVQSYNFVKAGVLNYTVEFRPKSFSQLGSGSIVQFTAVRNETTQKYMIEKEYKLC